MIKISCSHLFVVGHPMLSVGQQPTSKPYLLFTRTGLTELSCLEGILFKKSIMPQLDKFTYFTQFFWLCLFFFTFYIPFLLRSKRTTKVCLYLYNFTLFFVVFVRVVHFFSYQLFSYRQGGVCSAARFESAGLASFPRAGRSSSGNTAISYSC